LHFFLFISERNFKPTAIDIGSAKELLANACLNSLYINNDIESTNMKQIQGKTAVITRGAIDMDLSAVKSFVSGGILGFHNRS
jgi:hypothetical protein